MENLSWNLDAKFLWQQKNASHRKKQQESKANFSMSEHILPVWKIYHEILMRNFHDSKKLLLIEKNSKNQRRIFPCQSIFFRYRKFIMKSWCKISMTAKTCFSWKKQQESKAIFSMTEHILQVWKIYHEVLMQNFHDSKKLLPIEKNSKNQRLIFPCQSIFFRYGKFIMKSWCGISMTTRNCFP